MGWKFRWVSSYHSEFNYDFNVSWTREQIDSGRAVYNYGALPEWAADIEDLSGNSVFYKDEPVRSFTPTQRSVAAAKNFSASTGSRHDAERAQRKWSYHSLTDWARPRNMYGKGGEVEANGRFHQPACACQSHEPAPLEGIS
jgi:Uncharacterized protein conserved in bacteria